MRWPIAGRSCASRRMSSIHEVMMRSTRMFHVIYFESNVEMNGMIQRPTAIAPTMIRWADADSGPTSSQSNTFTQTSSKTSDTPTITPLNVLVCRKPGDPACARAADELITWLHQAHRDRVRVIVRPSEDSTTSPLESVTKRSDIARSSAYDADDARPSG